MTAKRKDAFAREYEAMAGEAEANGWHHDPVTKTWRNDQHARRYASLMMLVEKELRG